MIMDENCCSVDVRRFGAKGDGVTDDSAAFQAAVDSLRKTGGIVWVPPGGVYGIGSKVSIRSRQPIWIKSARAGKRADGARELTHAGRAQFRPLNNMDCMFERDVAESNELFDAGGGGAQGLQFTSMGTQRLSDQKACTAVNIKNARSFHIEDCFTDL
jgi:hypothetical protein